jgi:hypothetical protein
MALVGCPPPAPESITILDPLDLEAHDINLSSELASIAVLINLTSTSGLPIKEGSFRASVTEDIAGLGPEDVDDQGNLIEQPIDITAFVVNNAMLFPPIPIPPIDLSPWTSGLVPCEIAFDLSGVFRRTGT